MKAFSFAAADMLRRAADTRAEALRLSITCAFGQLALEGKRPLCRDTLSNTLRGYVSFYANEILMPDIERLTVAWTAKRVDCNPATAEIEFEPRRNGRRRVSHLVKVQYPDELLGLDSLLGLEPSSPVAGLYFNLTPGELVGNLYGAIAPVCSAFAIAEALLAEAETAIPPHG